MTDERTPWVLKVGGRELDRGPELARLVATVAQSVRAGRSVLIVHGGGAEVTQRADALGLATERRGGLRVTSEEMLEVVVEVLAGRVNSRLVAAFAEGGVPALGVSGVSARLLSVVPAGDPPGSLGRVGEPVAVDPRWLGRTLADGFTPVIAPLGLDARGQVHNVNADLAAGAVAAALSADLLLLTDVPAVRDDAGRSISTLSSAHARDLVRRGIARDGMIPKLDAAIRALEAGARSVWIGNLDGLGSEGPAAGSGTRVVATVAGRRPRLPSLAPPVIGTA